MAWLEVKGPSEAHIKDLNRRYVRQIMTCVVVAEIEKHRAICNRPLIDAEWLVDRPVQGSAEMKG